MALRFRAAVDSIVFDGGNGLQILRIVALQALHEGHSELARQVRVLAPRFLASAPTRVAKDVDVRSPERQTFVSAPFAVANKLVVFCPSLGRGRLSYLPHPL